MSIKISMSQEDFRLWRNINRVRARRAALLAAPEAYYVQGVGWCGPKWEAAQDAYCAALVGQGKTDA